MKNVKMFSVVILSVCLIILWMGGAAVAASYNVNKEKFLTEKNIFDDPRSTTAVTKKYLPPDVYKSFCHDIGKMQQLQAEVSGFKSPDVVGKIAPEIKPGKYSYQDKGNKPGLKALMIPIMYNYFFTKGGRPFAGCYPEIEVVPTRQVYNTLPQLELTLKSMGKTKQDAQGYIQWKTWEGGIPFPRPSGPDRIKAMQIIYNFQYCHKGFDDSVYMVRCQAVDKSFHTVMASDTWGRILRTGGRVTNPPYGWIDARAKEQGEIQTTQMMYLSPRDMYGSVTQLVARLPATEPDGLWAYSGMLRRVRKLSGTDSQDAAVGGYAIFDDAGGWYRKMSPTGFQMDFKITEEREFLAPAYDSEATQYISSKDMTTHGLKFERRPVYVIEVTHKDPSYVYGRTVLYVDKETFDIVVNESYDRQGRLWRSMLFHPIFYPEMGIRQINYSPNYDHQAEQSCVGFLYLVPVTYLKRDDFSIVNLGRQAIK